MYSNMHLLQSKIQVSHSFKNTVAFALVDCVAEARQDWDRPTGCTLQVQTPDVMHVSASK